MRAENGERIAAAAGGDRVDIVLRALSIPPP